MPRIGLKVNGAEYRGWESASVTLGIEALAGSFDLSVSDRWSKEKPWPILEGDQVSVELEGQQVIVGFVDNRNLGFDANSRSFGVTGRDVTGDLVDCSAVPTSWQFNGVPLDALIRSLCEPFGIPVAVIGDLQLPDPPVTFAINPGDKVSACIERVTRLGGFLAYSDGRGGLILSRAGSARMSTALIEGVNLKSANASFNASARFRRYIVTAQTSGSEFANGDQAAFIQGEATDPNIRESRTLLIRAESSQSPASAANRAQWEAAIRAARGGSLECEVNGWTTRDGNLWPLNKVIHVKAPKIAIDDDFLISATTFAVSPQNGTTTRLSLRRPSAFTPQPETPVDPWL